MFKFLFSKKPEKERIEPELIKNKILYNNLSDDELCTIIRASLRIARNYKQEQDQQTLDFILGSNGYENTTFEQKLSWLLVTTGNLFISEHTKKNIETIVKQREGV
ncbi:MAG: hypothetical protein [Caudoviricetes sp.]|nr:MAG: hypothetical protein [Caudoviricetes sp.]